MTDPVAPEEPRSIEHGIWLELKAIRALLEDRLPTKESEDRHATTNLPPGRKHPRAAANP